MKKDQLRLAYQRPTLMGLGRMDVVTQKSGPKPKPGPKMDPGLQMFNAENP